MICPKCGSLLSQDRDGSYFCTACLEAELALPPQPRGRDPRRRHTPEEAARRKKHGDAP